MNRKSPKSYRMGPGTYEVPIRLFTMNRERLVSELLKNQNTPPNSIIFMQGGDKVRHYDSELYYPFKQESFFMWTFGVNEPGYYGAINVHTDKSCLFVPRTHDEEFTDPEPLECIKKRYAVNFVHYVDDMKSFLKSVTTPSGVLLVLKDLNSGDHEKDVRPIYFEGIEEFRLNTELLYPIISELRVYKTDYEQDVIRYVVAISSEAHKLVMRNIKAGNSEYQAESIFQDYCYRLGGCRDIYHPCLCATGLRTATLYCGHGVVPNNRVILNGELCVFDMGTSYFGYASDITCSFPANGKFTNDQKFIYNAVLAANQAVHRAAKPGVSWIGMHLVAARTLLIELKKGGLLKGNIDRMMAAGLHDIFQPHGLGHLIGLDVHDVGGYLPDQPPKPTVPGLSKLQFARVLQPRMHVAIEPGCYFIKPLLDKAKMDPVLSRFIVREVLDRFTHFGGIRIEDNVFITKTGVEDLTNVPRTVQEIEEWMAGE